jgi:hypothetical protein
MVKFIKKVSKDIALTVYDDFKFKYMSLPRLVFAVSVVVTIVAWIADQFFGLKFDHFSDLINWTMASAAAYGVKKFVDKGRTYDDGEKDKNSN